jgi:hypothetical protein
MMANLQHFAGKANRLKQAKKEADTEINNYKAERERQYKDYESKVCTMRNVFYIYYTC